SGGRVGDVGEDQRVGQGQRVDDVDTAPLGVDGPARGPGVAGVPGEVAVTNLHRAAAVDAPPEAGAAGRAGAGGKRARVSGGQGRAGVGGVVWQGRAGGRHLSEAGVDAAAVTRDLDATGSEPGAGVGHVPGEDGIGYRQLAIVVDPASFPVDL